MHIPWRSLWLKIKPTTSWPTALLLWRFRSVRCRVQTQTVKHWNCMSSSGCAPNCDRQSSAGHQHVCVRRKVLGFSTICFCVRRRPRWSSNTYTHTWTRLHFTWTNRTQSPRQTIQWKASLICEYGRKMDKLTLWAPDDWLNGNG